AISLQDVEKCTRPNRSSLTSWARTSWAPDNHAAAAIAVIALDDPILMVSSSLEVPSRIAHLNVARDCCGAGFRGGLGPQWVIHIGFNATSMSDFFPYASNSGLNYRRAGMSPKRYDRKQRLPQKEPLM